MAGPHSLQQLPRSPALEPGSQGIHTHVQPVPLFSHVPHPPAAVKPAWPGVCVVAQHVPMLHTRPASACRTEPWLPPAEAAGEQGKAVPGLEPNTHGGHPWDSQLPALARSSPGCCSHVGSNPRDGRSSPAVPSLPVICLSNKDEKQNK